MTLPPTKIQAHTVIIVPKSEVSRQRDFFERGAGSVRRCGMPDALTTSSRKIVSPRSTRSVRDGETGHDVKLAVVPSRMIRPYASHNRFFLPTTVNGTCASWTSERFVLDGVIMHRTIRDQTSPEAEGVCRGDSVALPFETFRDQHLTHSLVSRIHVLPPCLLLFPSRTSISSPA